MKHRKFDESTKARAVEMYETTDDMSAQEVANRFGCHVRSLRLWIRNSRARRGRPPRALVTASQVLTLHSDDLTDGDVLEGVKENISEFVEDADWTIQRL